MYLRLDAASTECAVPVPKKGCATLGGVDGYHENALILIVSVRLAKRCDAVNTPRNGALGEIRTHGLCLRRIAAHMLFYGTKHVIRT